jgi:hypothetical protein
LIRPGQRRCTVGKISFRASSWPHTSEQIDRAVQAFAEAGRELGVI